MLCVRDLERSRTFYVDLLGGSVLDEEQHIVVVRLADMRLCLFTESPPTAEKPTVHLAPPSAGSTPPIVVVLRVEDADATYRELSDRGVVFLTPPMSPAWGGLRCFCRDPDGYIVEVEQPP